MAGIHVVWESFDVGSVGGAVLHSLLTIPQLGEDPGPPVEDSGLCDPPGEPGWQRVRLSVRVLAGLNISPPPPLLRDWVIKGHGMSSLVYATGHSLDLGL